MFHGSTGRLARQPPACRAAKTPLGAFSRRIAAIPNANRTQLAGLDEFPFTLRTQRDPSLVDRS
jgi:hypothetical protein